MDAFKSANFSVEEYEASCRKKFEVDNAIYKKIFTFLESRSFVNDEEKPERKFIWRKATTFQMIMNTTMIS
ncbi:hypothetical protein E2C01_026418 [Portunus trituberculatus]|uniref:Uncharacterized protein n=1 Tax=Portunus trituberculatus TaxID=210409 RepID=A0A5B7EI90_PORTR|nr:hypothetical protein [Portunus trituberculatus]